MHGRLRRNTHQVKIVSVGESPHRVALVDATETGIELTSIRAGSADDTIAEVTRLASQKHESYERRGIFDTRPNHPVGSSGRSTFGSIIGDL